jgi:ParB/RepB/Spo0J family partition protein
MRTAESSTRVDTQRAVPTPRATARPQAGEPGAAAGPPEPVSIERLGLGCIRPSARQPRRALRESEIERLAESIRQVGVLEPLCVRILSPGAYEIIAGERRWRASRQAGLTHVPCQVYDVTEDQAFVLALVENIQRQALSPLEEALAYQQMLDRGIARNRASIARLTKVTRQRITQRMKLLELDPTTQRKLEEHPDVLTEYHGRLLWEVRDVTVRHRLADECIANGWSGHRLQAAAEQRRRDAERERDMDGSRSLRTYSVARPGIAIRLNFMRADVADILETLRWLVRHVESLQQTQATDVPAGSSPTESVKTF